MTYEIYKHLTQPRNGRRNGGTELAKIMALSNFELDEERRQTGYIHDINFEVKKMSTLRNSAENKRISHVGSTCSRALSLKLRAVHLVIKLSVYYGIRLQYQHEQTTCPYSEPV
jgi:hypothetical protein